MKGSGSWVAINSQAIGVVSVSKKAGTEEILGLCWWQSHCSRAEKGKPSLRQSLCLNYILLWPRALCVPLRYKSTLRFSTSHKTQENYFRTRRVHARALLWIIQILIVILLWDTAMMKIPVVKFKEYQSQCAENCYLKIFLDIFHALWFHWKQFLTLPKMLK